MTLPAVVFTRATLSAGDTSTEYLRAGRGGTVLLLITAGGESALSLKLIAALSQRCRVIAPTGIAAGPAFGASLDEFLEGLGVMTTAIVAEGAFCAPMVEYIATGSGAVTRAALLVDPGDDSVTEALQGLAGAGPALLVRAVAADLDHAGLDTLAEELLQFLA